jgi:hypothetical protein
MIKTLELGPVLDRVFQEVQTLPLAEFQVRKIDVEWVVDPEIDGWETLCVTLWAYASIDDCLRCWQELNKAMDGLRQKMTKADLDKLNKHVFVGVDTE